MEVWTEIPRKRGISYWCKDNQLTIISFILIVYAQITRSILHCILTVLLFLVLAEREDTNPRYVKVAVIRKIWDLPQFIIWQASQEMDGLICMYMWCIFANECIRLQLGVVEKRAWGQLFGFYWDSLAFTCMSNKHRPIGIKLISSVYCTVIKWDNSQSAILSSHLLSNSDSHVWPSQLSWYNCLPIMLV